MKRHHTLKPRDQWREGETWSQYVRRLVGPKVMRAAEERRDRAKLTWRWPAIVRVKTSYDRRRRARNGRNR